MAGQQIYKNCRKEFTAESAAQADREECVYHPQAPARETADQRMDYADFIKYPCCGQVSFAKIVDGRDLEPEPIAGCTRGKHVLVEA